MQGLPSNFRTIRFDGRSSGADFAILLPVKSRNSSWPKYRRSNIFSIMLCCRARNFKLGICTKASSDICNSLLYYRNTVVSFVNFNSKSRISGPKFKKPNLKVFRFCAHRSLSGLHRKIQKTQSYISASALSDYASVVDNCEDRSSRSSWRALLPVRVYL